MRPCSLRQPQKPNVRSIAPHVAFDDASGALDLPVLHPVNSVRIFADLVAHLLRRGAVDEAHRVSLDGPATRIVLALYTTVALVEFAIGRPVVHLSLDC